jgi:DNA-binding transcriptional ArsR family regulator
MPTENRMPTSHPLPAPLADAVARRFRVLGEPVRIRLLDRMRAGEHSVGELVQAVGASQQNVSKHLGVLHQAGIVSRRKDGNRVVYDIADQTVSSLCETVCGGLARQAGELARLLEPALAIAPNEEVSP